MRFGEELAEFKSKSPYAAYCVDYDGLKKEIKDGEDRGDFGEENEAIFLRRLEDELEKVTGFHQMKSEELEQRLTHLELLVEDAGQADKGADKNRLDRIEEELELCSGLLTALDRYTKMNYTAFLKILKKHDKLTNFQLRTMFMMRMAYRPFYAVSFDDQLLLLSKLYSALNSLRSGYQSSLSGGAVDASIRRKRKFWVHPDNVTEVKIEILKHLPVIVFARQKADYDPGVSSIYFDNDAFESYKDRVMEAQESELIRVSWPGQPGQDLSDSKVRVERKRKGPGGITERFELKEKYLKDYLAGTWTMAAKLEKKRSRGTTPEGEIAALEELASGIQRSVLDRKLRPVLGVYYNRTAFQLIGDDTMSVSLDTEIAFFREDSTGVDRTAGGWRRADVTDPYPFKSLPKDECNVFPFAVLEIDYILPPGVDDPAWMQNLVRSGAVEPVPRFSKFVHGLAVLMEDAVPLLPNWLPQLDRDIRKMASSRSLQQLPEADVDEIDTADDVDIVEDAEEDGEEDGGEEVDVYEATPAAGGRTSGPTPGGPSGAAEEGRVGLLAKPGLRKKRVAVPVRVEPKVFFANERTLLSWLRFTIVLGGLAIGMLNFSDRVGQVTGALFSIVAMGIMLYSFALYVWRTRMIEIRYAGPYDDRIGPIVVVVALFTCVLVNLWLRFDGGIQGVLKLFYPDGEL
ncbi:VTC domain-containing protein [Hyaloraphidium curvatum]|nr:VTC domain-containing protein [Hyaloraphidium curvatum]